MKMLRSILRALIVVEVIALAVLLLVPRPAPTPILPEGPFQDPLIGKELERLAENARNGKSSDWFTLGDALLGQGDYSHAELAYRESARLDSWDSLPLFRTALCVDRTGRIPESTEIYRQAARLAKPQNQVLGSKEHILYHVGRNQLREVQAAEAEKTFLDNIQFQPSRYQYAKLLVRSGRAADAMPFINEILNEQTRNLKFLSLKLAAYEAQGRDIDAQMVAFQLDRSEYSFPIDLNTNLIEPLSRRYGIPKEIEQCAKLSESSDFDKTAQCITSLLELLEPTNHLQKYALRKYLVQLEYQRKDPAAMLASIEILRNAGMSDADLLQMEGAALSMQGDQEKAVKLWLKAIEMAPNIPLHQILADHFEKAGEAEKAQYHRGQKALLTTKMQYWSNQLKEAEQTILEAKELIPEEPEVWFYSGEIHFAQERRVPAIHDYQECVKLAPQHGRAARRIKLLESLYQEKR